MSEQYETIEVEAAHWFAVRRRGVMSIDEHRAYRNWSRDPANTRALARMEEVWQAAGAVTPRSVVRASLSRAAAIAAICVVTLGLGALSADAGTFWTNLDWVNR